MIGTMTFAGLDVHARSTHAAAFEVLSGELRRARFGAGSDEVVAWLRGLPQPVYACYEAALLPRNRHPDRVRARTRGRRLPSLPAASPARLLAWARPQPRPIR